MEPGGGGYYPAWRVADLGTMYKRVGNLFGPDNKWSFYSVKTQRQVRYKGSAAQGSQCTLRPPVKRKSNSISANGQSLFSLSIEGQAYSLTPRLPLFMTPLFNGISVSGVDYSQPEPKNMQFLQTLAVICGKPRIFAQSVFSRGGNEIKSTPIYLFYTSGSP
jgi:hypothetical protein